tara:strand:- start:298 stop:624 length:327 start_codon:yes stop_codon:yes gene_type:complete
MYTYTYVATKTITITEEAYNKLKAKKLPKESFSQEIVRIVGDSGSIMDLAGAWSDMSDEEAERIEKGIENMRKSSRLKELEKHWKELKNLKFIVTKTLFYETSFLNHP